MLSVAIFFLFLLIAATSCKVQSIIHDQVAAGRTAEEFGRAAFVAQDYDAAYRYLTLQRANDFTVSSLEKMVSDIHVSVDFPESIKATEYEIIPGAGIVNIYLDGKTSSGNLRYCIVTAGDQKQGYVVNEFYRSTGEDFPKTSSRKHF